MIYTVVGLYRFPTGVTWLHVWDVVAKWMELFPGQFVRIFFNGCFLEMLGRNVWGLGFFLSWSCEFFWVEGFGDVKVSDSVFG